MLRVLMAINAFAGTVIAAIAAYYTAAPYYGWKPSSEGPMGAFTDVSGYWKIAFLAVGLMLIVLSVLQAFGVIGGQKPIRRRRPIFIADLNIAAMTPSPTAPPVLLIGTAALNEKRLRIVVKHSHYVAGLGWANWVSPWQVELADLMDIIAGQKIIVPVVSCNSTSVNSADLMWGPVDGALVNAIKNGTTYRAQIRIIAADGKEQQPIHFLLISATIDERPYLVNVIKETEFSFIAEWTT